MSTAARTLSGVQAESEWEKRRRTALERNAPKQRGLSFSGTGATYTIDRDSSIKAKVKVKVNSDGIRLRGFKIQYRKEF